MLSIAVASPSASADVVNVTKLLQAGYEVRAAYEVSVGLTGGLNGRQGHFMILQKGASAYQCSSANTGKPEYSNSYSCVPVLDAE